MATAMSVMQYEKKKMQSARDKYTSNHLSFSKPTVCSVKKIPTSVVTEEQKVVMNQARILSRSRSSFPPRKKFPTAYTFTTKDKG
jgi:hypothetical protein